MVVCIVISGNIPFICYLLRHVIILMFMEISVSDSKCRRRTFSSYWFKSFWNRLLPTNRWMGENQMLIKWINSALRIGRIYYQSFGRLFSEWRILLVLIFVLLHDKIRVWPGDLSLFYKYFFVRFDFGLIYRKIVSSSCFKRIRDLQSIFHSPHFTWC